MLVNFSDLRPGEYPARVAYAEERTGKKGVYLWLEFELGGDAEGYVLGRGFSLSPAALNITKRQLKAILGESLEGLIDTTELCERLLGRECTVLVDEEVYAGEIRVGIRDVLPA